MSDSNEPDSQQSELLHKTILDAFRDAIMATDLSGCVVYVNPAFERLYGYSSCEVIGKTPSFLRSNQHDSSFYEQMWEALKRGLVWEDNVYNSRKDGSVVLVEQTMSPVVEDDGQYYLVTMRELMMKGAHSVKGKTPKTQDTMAAGLAHDFNNLISPLLGYTEMATMKIGNGLVPDKEVQQIMRAGTRAKELALQVLTFCRQDSTELEVIFLDGIIKDVVSLQQVNLPNNITIATNIGPDCGTVLGEPIQMHQVLMNLCSNALHAMHDGGQLTISLSPTRVSSSSTEYSELSPGDYVKLTVNDTGHGMDEETMQLAFAPFFTRKDKGEGVGLGLAMVQNIVHDHGGEVCVHSEVGKGTTFDVLLPRREKYQHVDTQTIPAQEMSVGQSAIMLVDDEQAIVQMGKNMLEYIGYNVIGLTGSQQALERFRTRPGDFDLIITDQVMPGMQGHELATAIRDIRADIPIVFITGFTKRLPKDEIDKLGNCDALQKPFSSSELIKAVQDLLVSK